MPSFEPVRVGIIGSGWITEQHLSAFAAIPEAQVVALADYPRDRGGRDGRGRALASSREVSRYFDDYRRLLEVSDVEAVTVSLPNVLHAEVALAALDAGKHIIVEKPLCLSLEDADRIVALAAERGLVAAYAEELCYCPKYVRGKQLVEQGAIGELFWAEQVEVHAGPYSDWFFDRAMAGGGALMDMGCHALEYVRWMFDKRPVQRVTAQLATHVHRRGEAPLEDHCLVHLGLEGGVSASVQAGWTLKGGMTSTAHLRGTGGAIDLDLIRGQGISMFSEAGVTGEDGSRGWSRPDFEWLWQNGYPQEMTDFARAIREGRTPQESASDGRAVLEVMWAAYASAAEGRTIELPYRPPAGVELPVDPWLKAARRVVRAGA